MRVLIAGCGYVGSALAAELAAQGDEVTALRRRPGVLPPGVRPLAVDLEDPVALAAVPDDLDAVVYAVSPGGGDAAAYRAACVTGVQLLAARLRGTPVRRWLLTSSTGVYAQQDGEWVDEDSPAEPSHASGRLLLEGEAVLRAAAPRPVVVRLGGIYGPGRTGLIDRVRSGQASVAPGPPRYTNRIHRDDAAGILRFLLAHPDPAPLYLGVDSDPASEREVQGWLAERLGVPPPREAPMAPESRRARGNRRCSNRRLRAAGYVLRFPSYREGYGALLAQASR